jgi:hypothetical protein
MKTQGLTKFGDLRVWRRKKPKRNPAPFGSAQGELRRREHGDYAQKRVAAPNEVPIGSLDPHGMVAWDVLLVKC